MNDDYEFEHTNNSRLSSVFEEENGDSISSLIYKAPKQPVKFSTTPTSKTFHKCINLYQMYDEKLCGRYIVAIIRANQNVAQLLIYQSKANIFIRLPVLRRCLYFYRDHSLILNVLDREFKIVFENEQDYLEFKEEFVKNGGIIDIFHNNKLLNHNLNENQLKLDNCAETENIIDTSKIDTTGRDKIVNRLEKMGLPLLPPFPSVKNNSFSRNFESIATNSLESSMQIEKIDETSKSKQKIDEVKLSTSPLISYQTDYNELKDSMVVLNSKLEKMISFQKSTDISYVRKLESKIKCLEVKNENLQSELDELCKRQISHAKKEASSDGACQTDNLNDEEKDISHLIEILNIIKSVPLEKNEIEALRKVKEEIGKETSLNLEPHFDFAEKENEEICRKEFVSQLKEIMSDMYENISILINDINTKKILAKEVKLASLKILELYNSKERKTH